MMSLGIDTGVETSSEVPHHSHCHGWCYLLVFFPNRLLPRHLQAYERTLAAQVFLVLFLHFRRKTRLIKWASARARVCVCLCTISPPPNNFYNSYAIDAKCWLHMVSNWNSPTPLIPFLNFENFARETFLKLIFSPFN